MLTSSQRESLAASRLEVCHYHAGRLYLSNQPCQDTLHFLDAHINRLDHTSVKHTRWHVLTTTRVLQFGQAL